MITEFNRLFLKDLDKLPTATLKADVADAIEAVEAAASLAVLVGVKKLKGYRNAYRIRVGDFRIGFYKKGELIEFVRILHRRDIYRLFP